MSNRVFRRFSLVVALLLASGSPLSVKAAAPPCGVVEVRTAQPVVVLADVWGVDRLVYGGGRTRIVQICAVVMSIALFIMMRKLH